MGGIYLFRPALIHVYMQSTWVCEPFALIDKLTKRVKSVPTIEKPEIGVHLVGSILQV